MQSLGAIIFDVDGTLADTEEIHRQAFNRAFGEFGLPWRWTPAVYEQLLAISGGFERILYYARDFPFADRAQAELHRRARDLHRLKTHFYEDMITSGTVSLRPGVRRLIDEARTAGIRLAIATSSSFGNLKALLDKNLPADWIEWFASIQTSDTVALKKPSAAVYDAVLDELAIDPGACIAIEDTENGLTAATTAGIRTIIATHFFTRNHRFTGAALVIDSLGEAGRPFHVVHGDSGGRDHVDLGLLRHLLKSPAPAVVRAARGAGCSSRPDRAEPAASPG